ncbi:TonB-dependent receptor domain-containing protein [Flavobacterium sp. NKUCC04_CG]|uniref:TonB-dependent receptor domain-containing protein n=1 Tax=Flavobacterium sp. NKUCC04_CG TaxID=2842121 RepID=UPI001C5A68F8|nr:TonB-dependent receptor [Flavobacterium sp. NKUCC04_CG]MBW3517674.1 TonB-dependent receptor [Flavobacterium sp. NKUCC04_CG]
MKNRFIVALTLLTVCSYGQTEAQIDSILAIHNIQLGEVLITAKKPLFSQKSDKMIFNVENSVLSEGSNVLDLLARAPGVVVGQDGDISLRGKSGVSVMINGKMTYLSQKDLANMLKSTTSGAVKHIEVITNPSAKYDAAGNAGIVNIVLKTAQLEGLNGTIFTNYGRGRKNRTNSGFSLNYSKARVNVFGDYSYTFRGEEERKTFKQDFYNPAQPSILERHTLQRNTTDEPLTSNNFKFGADYALSTNSQIGFLVDAKLGRYEDRVGGRNSLYNGKQLLLTDALTRNHNKESWNDLTYSINGRHQFNEKGLLLNFDIQYKNNSFNSNQLQQANYLQIDPESTVELRDRRGQIPSSLEVWDATVDLVVPWNAKNNLELGWKSSIKSNDNPSTYEFQESDHWVIDPSATNHFVFKEQIHAGYANYKFQGSRFHFQAGLRMEYTTIDGEQRISNLKNTDDYIKFFPSLSMKYELNDQNAFHTSYSKRINRPSHFDLNPFRFYDDPFNYWYGNSDLIPEITHSVELGYSWRNWLMSSLYFSQTNNVMTEVFDYDSLTNTTASTQKNLDHSYNYGINITSSVNLFSWWSMSNLFNVFENRYRGNYKDMTIDTNKATFTLSSQNAFQIATGFQAEANGQYHAKSNIGLYERAAYFDLTLGLSKQILNEKGSIKLSLTDVLRTRNYEVISHMPSSTISKNYSLDSRIATLSFTYKI